METQLLVGRRHTPFLCSSSSLSLSKKLKKNRGGGGGALFSIYFFNRQFFQTSILSFLLHLSLKLYFFCLISLGGDRVLGGKKSPSMVVKNKAIADPSFTTSSEENNNNNNKTEATVIPQQKQAQGRGFYRCDRPHQEEEKKEGKKCQKVKPQI